MRKAQNKPNPDRFGWNSGSIVILKEGTGEPYFTDTDIDRIVKKNGPPRQRAAKGKDESQMLGIEKE